MALHDILHWKAPDATADLNARTRGMRRSIFPTTIGSGGVGLVTPSASSLNVTVQPFLAQGFDGLAVLSDSVLTSTLPVPPAGPALTYWLTLYVRYQLSGPSLMVFSFVPDNTILTALDREYYIRFAKVTVATGTTNAAAATWDFSVGDHSEQVGQSRWRSPVANAAALPVAPTYGGNPPNHDGDVRVTLDTHFSYVWSQASQTWSVVSGAGALTASVARSNELDRKVQRSNVGTGFLGLGHNEGAYADSIGAIGAGFQLGDGPIVNSTPSAFNLRVAPFQMAVNGHKLAIMDSTIPLPAPPAVTTRYDLVYLEVYRSQINTPIGGIVYDNNIAGTYTFAEIETLIEQIFLEDPYFGSSNFNFGGVELAEDGSLVLTLWQWSVKAGITYTGPTATNYVVSEAAPCNVPGLTAPPHNYLFLSQNKRIGVAMNNAAHPGVWDGVAYGVPAFVVRRNVLEASYTASRTVGASLSGCTIWSLLPMADSEVARPQVRRLLQDGVATSPLAPGVLKGYESPITWANGGGAGPVTVTVPEEKLVLTFPTAYGQYSTAFQAGVEIDALSQALTLPVPPVAGARRDFLALLYWATPSALLLSSGNAFSKGVQLLDTTYQGGRTLYVYGMYTVMSVGTATDEADAFAAASLPFYETGGAVPFAPVAGDQHPGLWVAAPTGSALNEHGIDAVFAMPVSIIHRRNSTVYSDLTASTNFNGSTVGGTLRPEEEFAGLPAAAYDLLDREVVDLRHATGADLDLLLSKSMDQLTRGQLSTRLQRNPLDATVAGTSHLAIDVIGATVGLGLSPVTEAVPGTRLDGIRHSFTDAQELQVVSWTTDAIAATVATGADYVIPSTGVGTDAATHYDYVQQAALQDAGGNPIFKVTYKSPAAGGYTKLNIRAPQGAYLHSSMRANADFIVGAPIAFPASENYQQIGLVSFAHIHGTLTGAGAPRTNIVRAATAQASYGGAVYDARISYNFLHDSAVAVANLTVLAVDALNRPTHVEIEFPYVDDPGLATVASVSGKASIQVVAAFQYDKPKTANKLRTDYNNYGLTIDDRITGLSLAPKRIFTIDGQIRGTAYTNISVGPLYKTISRPCTGTTQVAVSAADFPGENNIKIYGLLGNPLIPGGGTQKVRALETGATFPNSTLTVTFDAALPGAGNVTFKVAYTSDERKYWVEALKTNRGIVGPFTWVSEEHLLSNDVSSRANLTSTVSERLYVSGVQHPVGPQNRFTIGLPNGDAAVLNDLVCENQALFGWFNHNGGTYYTSNDVTWYAGAKINPWTAGGFGRTEQSVSGSDNLPVLGATAGYYDTFGSYAFPGVLSDPVVTGTVLVYPTQIPLDGSVADHLVVTYEGYAYQGIMGDNDSLANRLSRLQAAVVPPAVGDDLIYDAVSDVYVTTAGTGLPYMDGRQFGVLPFGYTSGLQNAGCRWTFYSPDMAKDNGISNAYRQTKLNSERLRQLHSAADVNYTFPDDDSDLLMHFIPGPATQYCPTPNGLGVDIGSFAGVGPGTMSDYDHSTLTSNLVVQELLTTDRSNYQRTPSVTVKVPASDGYAAVRIPYNPSFFAYWTSANAPGMAHGDHDLLLNTTAGDLWYVGTLQTLGNLPPTGQSPQAGFRLKRTITNGDITVLTNQLNTFTTFASESVGKPLTATPTRARGTQGYPTFRPGYPGPVALTESTWLGKPSENLLSGCAHDANLLSAASIGTFVLSESSASLAHQQAGNPFFATQGNYYDQTLSDYALYPTVNHLLMPQKFWAFRGSAINRAGQVRLLINSGFGSNLLGDVQNPNIRYAGHRAHLGFSADAFDLLHRPVRRP